MRALIVMLVGLSLGGYKQTDYMQTQKYKEMYESQGYTVSIDYNTILPNYMEAYRFRIVE